MSLQRLDVGLARRASVALDTISRTAGGSAPPEVITRLKGLPALLRTSGLPATMAFLYAKAGGEDPLEIAYRTVRDALLAEVAAVWDWGDERPDAMEFFARIGDPARVSATDLARATARLEEFANWLRRLAEALERAAPRSQRGTTAARHNRGRSDGHA
ncbi:MAG: type III-B CRISPR module-associated protein Cmr5 [Streptosporangiaceae bacterium]